MRRWLIFLLLAGLCRDAAAQPVKLLCNWGDTARAPLNQFNQRFNDCWGFVQGGREYAVIGSSSGAHIIDVNNCREVAYARGTSEGVIHRDYKTYRHYLYAVADEGVRATLQIYDLDYLPDSLHLVYQSDSNFFNRCHTIFIDTATAKLYGASFSLPNGVHDYMRVFSLANPVQPTVVARYNLGGDVHAVYVRNDTAYCSSSYAGYYVVDFTKAPAKMPIIGGLTSYQYQGFNHSSWVGPDGIGVMSDETWGRPMKVIDTRNLLDIQVTGYISPRGSDSTSIPHNPYIRGRFAYISYYLDGFQLYDISDPYHPRQAGHYQTFGGTPYQGFAGAWGCYPYLPSRHVLVSDMQHGLYVLDADEAIGINKTTEFGLYPNPAATVVFLQLPYGVTGALHADVLDITGRRVFSNDQLAAAESNPALAVPLPPTMAAGVYVIRAAIAGHIYTARLIKR